MARIKPQALLQQSKKKKGPARISVTTIILSSLIVVVTVFFLYATYRHWSQRSRIQIGNKQSVFEFLFCSSELCVQYRYIILLGQLKAAFHCSCAHGDNSYMNSKKSDLRGYAILDTAKGLITVELFKDSSPEVVDQFLDLCHRGQFNGMLFRHVVKHYVIQAGDNDKLGAAEDWNLKGNHYSQLDTSLKHEVFMLGTSKAKHDNEGFELFITTAPIPDLNEKLIVFGKVVKGEDVVQEIEEVDTDEHYRPKSSIAINRVTLKQSI
ncbi:peptidyl-prolyl cis-trans isomerase CYP21-3, mitochondrial-like isoform X1 [Durio zibethinus]|uniref:Peptidyl-prolyl cis-trans isomerase n=1 Tax=Durio zibethinus TaxID=66656 RepID=A0A6P6B1C0_DURZI|nr:peptidyl-prolyl cis-trans isomerase CYP21-3, mitochondrial-like isoform X1 [Durio zibethinus]XP_022770797.1 peptidyl-prolyl cis-trans isomerase CYP21-3, mitochondrial-like isoform X1 [Durio zibethinus]XP_022770798.1 peptidyl-prolyl cis-trans isomerase CYP21-3, mitochondrial-like isoform X1 [Durio zibethinus]